MPISGSEEGVNPRVWQSSDSHAGIPLKKRKFMLVRPPSPEPAIPSSPEPEIPSLPEPETPFSPHLESHHEEEQCIGKSVLSTSNASGTTEFSGFLCASSTEKTNPGKGEEGSAGENVSLALNSVNYSDSNNLQSVSTGFGCELSLQLAPSKNLVPEMGKEEVVRKTDCSTGVEIERTRNPIKTELLFVSKLSVDKALAGEQPQSVCKDQDKLDPYKWNLGGQKFSNSIDLKLALTSPHDANRTHWDLNTTLETWEGSLNGEASIAGNDLTDAVDGASTLDIKPVIGSSQMVTNKPEGSNVDLGKTILNKNKQQCGTDGLLRLGVHPSVPQPVLSLGPCFPNPKEVDSNRVTSNLRLPERLVPPPERPVPSPKVVANRIVKSEPSDEGCTRELVVKVGPPKSVPSQGCNAETHKPSKIPQTSVNLRVVKFEPGLSVCVRNPERVEKVFMQAEIRPSNSVVHTPVAVASNTGTPVTEGISRAAQFHIAGLSNTKELVDHALLPSKKEMLLCGDVEHGASNNVIAAVGSLSQIARADGKESKSADDTLGLPEKECPDVANPDDTKLNLMDDHHSKPLERVSKSDEKVDVPAEEERSHETTDCASDGNHDTNAHGVENNDRKNGEVQKPLEHSAIEDGLGKVGEVLDDARNFPDVNRESASDVDMDISESDDCAENSQSISLDLKEEQGHNNMAFMKGPLPAVAPEFIKYAKLLDQTKRELQRGNMLVLASDVATSTNTGLTTSFGKDVAVALHEDINKRVSSLGASSWVFSKTESHVNNEEIAKDVNVGGNRSRIINLPRASSSVSQSGESGKNLIDGMVLSSQNQGEGSSDEDFKGDKFRGRGNREGRYMDPIFERKRNRDHQLFRSSGSEFRRSRGRVDNRIRSMRNEWDPEFSIEHCHGPSNFRFNRSKDNTSAKFEGSDFVPQGGRTVGTGWGRRKSLDNELLSYRHPPSRRRSPDGREGPVSRGVRIRRGPRDISPDRCIPEDDPDLIGLRHEEKFTRVLPGEVMTKDFSRSQPQYERLEDSFLHGNQRFLPRQRRMPLHMSRVHSKSPPRFRSRSPGPWSSPRRRSPDEFVGHPDLNNCRSPRLYRIERMRSPQRYPCFAEGMVLRRNGSPPQYISRSCNDSREIGSSRELDHPRSHMRSRSPGQIVPRNARRFVVDPRERSETDDLFAEAIHSGRFHGLVVGNGGEDDRRNGIERSGPVRSFHPPYNGNSDVVNFHHHDEDGPLSRPYRFIPEVDAEIHERGNTRRRGFERGSLRGRGFERRMKHQPDKSPPRTRSAEEQEENYWQIEQQKWHEMSPF